MRLGFTGSSKPIPETQDAALAWEMAGLLGYTEGHHGDCLNADERFDHWCEVLGIERHVHPGHNASNESPMRAWCKAEVVLPSRPYLHRNRDIVDNADLLIACPSGAEVRRSGVWSTVRYARSRELPVTIIWPTGEVNR